MRRSDVILAALVVADIIAIAAWVNIAPASPMIAAVGLAGPRADTDRYCSAWYRQDAWIQLPSRHVTCHGWFDVERPHDRQEISYDQVMRRVVHVRSSMSSPDSAMWSAQLDSIARSIHSRGGREIVCPLPYRALTYIKTERHWRFDGFDVRLIAYRFEDQKPPLAEWLLQIDGFSPRAPGCGVAAPA